jgi:thioesterase-3
MKTSTKIRIRNYHIDNFGHVNHARFVELLEEARWRYLEDNDLLHAIHRFEAMHVVREIKVQYRQPATIGNVLQIDTQIIRRSTHSFWVEQIGYVEQSKMPAIEATIANVFIDRRGRPLKVSDEILDIWLDLANADIC